MTQTSIFYLFRMNILGCGAKPIRVSSRDYWAIFIRSREELHKIGFHPKNVVVKRQTNAEKEED